MLNDAARGPPCSSKPADSCTRNAASSCANSVAANRYATRFSIKAMDLGESAAYLRHHLVLAGREEPLFADDAVARLHRVSNGLPRALNNAATAALIAAAAENKDLVNDACAKKAAAESHPGLIMLNDTARGPPCSSKPADSCTRNAASSCANSVAANTGPVIDLDDNRDSGRVLLPGAERTT